MAQQRGSVGAPWHPLLGDFEPGNARKRQSSPCRAAQPPHFLRDRRSPRGVTRSPRTAQRVTERSQVPSPLQPCPFHLAPLLGLSWASPGCGGTLPLAGQSCVPKHTWHQGGRQRLPHKGQALLCYREPPQGLRNDRRAPKSLGSGAL